MNSVSPVTGGAESRGSCPVCGTKLPANSLGGLCPVCLLREAADLETQTGLVENAAGTPDDCQGAQRDVERRTFEHYEILLLDDGQLHELGRGAMGVTYKAFDVNLRCPVALKVLSPRFLEDESARARFLREARVAVRVRHPNVASVFHLGSRGRELFYAMELVEGETLEDLIRRSGPLEPRRALQITAQAAAGLAAAHKEHLVHRDIKSSNLMLTSGETGRATVKIIDLGLAKPVEEAASTLSRANAFIGTPYFASPEQCSGRKVDIRSDIYSLGVTLWEMLTGEVPFTGAVTQVLSQQLSAPLPLEKLVRIPRPVVGLLKSLLEKDPEKRLQDPVEVEAAVQKVERALDRGWPLGLIRLRNLIPPSRLPVVLWILLALLVAGGITGAFKLWPIRHASRAAPEEISISSGNGIAVLPFENLSADLGSGYFADGIQDDILTSLAKISALKVISRNSVMRYRSVDTRNLGEIGQALGVTHLLEGTVRRDGNRVRIGARLVDARTANTEWAETYDRDLTDIFAIQSEIAQTIATHLRAKLSTAEKRSIEERPTDDLVAYDLYLQAKGLNTFFASGELREQVLKQASLLTETTQRDPRFALAYSLLAHAHDYLYQFFYDHTPERRAKAEAAINEAMRLRPDLPETRLALASHLYMVEGDYERARTQVAIAQEMFPNSPEALVMLARIDRRQGRWGDSMKNLEKAVELDPQNLDMVKNLAITCYLARRYRDGERVWEKILKLAPEDQNMMLMRRLSLWGEKADLNLVQAALAVPFSEMSSDFAGARFYLAICAHDWPIAKQTLQAYQRDEFPVNGDFNCFVPRSFCDGLIAQFEGDAPKAKAEFSRARLRLQQKVAEHPDDPWSLSYLGLVDAFLGNKEDAISEGTRAIEKLPTFKDALNGPFLVWNLAAIYAWAGDPGEAINRLAPMIGKPLGPEYGDLKFNPIWDPLRNDPRFARLLADAAPPD
jgi:serine/threonine protein kinase/tetratricopeptide (TPR) repeat protein